MRDTLFCYSHSLLPLLAVGLLCGCGHPPADTPKPTAPPMAVQCVKPHRGSIMRNITLPGSLKANQQATLYAKVAGYLKSLAVDKGDVVKAGQTLAVIEVPELLADIGKSKAEAEVAETEYKRVSEARRKAPDLVTPQTVDEALGRLKVSRASLEHDEALLSFSRIAAPFDGIVTARYVDPGAFIPAATSGSAPQTAAVVTIMDFNIVRAQVAVPELEAALVRAGQPIEMAVEGLPGKTFKGTVSRITYALDDATKTMLVEVDLPNPNCELRPGMYATVKIGVEKHADSLLIPVEALVVEKTNAFVFLATGGKAKKTPIKIGFNDGAKVEVLDGLAADAAVILVGKATLADGQPVNETEAK